MLYVIVDKEKGVSDSEPVFVNATSAPKAIQLAGEAGDWSVNDFLDGEGLTVWEVRNPVSFVKETPPSKWKRS